MDLLKNKWFWIGIGGLILLFIIWKNWNRITRFFQKRNIRFKPGESLYITDSRKQYLESMAKQAYDDIYNTPTFGHNELIYVEINKVTDNELLYLSEFYNDFLTRGNSLKYDIKDETFVFTDVNNKLIQRLNKIGE